MKRTLLTLTLIGSMIAGTASAYDLGYMANPPKERTVEDIQTELTQAQNFGQKEKERSLERELANKLSELQPAAGGSNVDEGYDHYLGH